MICTRSMNLSLGLRPVIISKRRNIKWPPSKAGMGRMFMNASMMERKAVILQKSYQFHSEGKRLPMVTKPPSDVAPSWVKTYLKSLT